MVGVNRSIDRRPPESTDCAPLGLRPVVTGTACCVVSALGYTGANICMRYLAKLEVEETWAIFNKELVTVAVVGPWLLWRAVRGRFAWPAVQTLVLLVVVGLAVQLGANRPVQWSLGVPGVGLAVAIPAIFGVMLTASALLGWMLLGERVSQRAAGAIGLLLVALVTLGIAIYEARDSDPSKPVSLLLLLLGIGAPCMAGAIYAVLTITIRHTATGGTPISVIVFIITLMGVVTLGPMSVYRLGTQALMSTPAEHFAWMLAAGALNLIAFLAITKGLELTTAVHANVLNASQVAMAAVAGVLWFGERLTEWVTLGVCLTITGIVLFGRPEKDDREADRHA